MADAAGAAPTAASSSSSSSASLPPLPPGWTQNTAPTGHTYYYNAQTRESTYRRPARPPSAPPPPPVAAARAQPIQHNVPFSGPPAHGPQGPAPFLRLSDPRVANAFMAKHNASSSTAHQHGGRGGGRGGGGRGGGRGGHNDAYPYRPRPQPVDKPRSRIPIPDNEPWVLVYTKYGRRFVHNTAKNASYWRIPEKLLPVILEMDKAGIRQKVEAALGEKRPDKAKPSEEGGDTMTASKGPAAREVGQENDTGSDYEDVEVTDEGEEFEGEHDNDGDGDGDNRRKRQRTEDGQDDELGGGGGDGDDGGGPVEFSEADIAFQLQAAAGELDEGYDQEDWDGQGEEGGEGAYENGKGEGEEEQDAAALFKSLLDDFQINPFSAWEKLIEEGKVFDDPRYTALPTMKARKAVWEEWSRDTIRDRKAQRARDEATATARRDPRAAYLQLLQDHATPKLYWAEFKRKYRKEPAMKDSAAPQKEKDKEKLYREYVARRKLPFTTQKADLTKLLESLPRAALNNQTDLAASGLPLEVTGDLRYVALETKVRNALVDAFLRTAGPPPAE